MKMKKQALLDMIKNEVAAQLKIASVMPKVFSLLGTKFKYSTKNKRTRRSGCWVGFTNWKTHFSTESLPLKLEFTPIYNLPNNPENNKLMQTKDFELNNKADYWFFDVTNLKDNTSYNAAFIDYYNYTKRFENKFKTKVEFD